MAGKKLLLLSNSVNEGMGYLEHAEQIIKAFLGNALQKILFVPYAGVRFSFADYALNVRERFAEMGYDLESIHTANNPVHAIENAEAMAVGGGNTFHLLQNLYQNDLIEAIRQRANSGMPYMGWSAGSNVACPTIKTTNDMPIIQPPSFDALGLVPFQINPHYLNAHPAGHQGETREERLLEFIEVNPNVHVVGL